MVRQIIRRFDIEMLNPGTYYIDGGLAIHKDFKVQLSERLVSKT